TPGRELGEPDEAEPAGLDDPAGQREAQLERPGGARQLAAMRPTKALARPQPRKPGHQRDQDPRAGDPGTRDREARAKLRTQPERRVAVAPAQRQLEIEPGDEGLGQ